MIKIICVGKIKENFYKEAIKEYQKRLTKYTKLEIIEIEDESIAEKAKKIEGTQLSSIELSKTLNNWQTKHPNIVFVIGGSYGLSDEVKQRSNYKLSFSNMTFPHQLFRVILLEQIYRSYKIINGETYHK